MSPAPDQAAATGGEPSAGGLGAVDPGVLGVIAELQGKLSALGKAHEERLKRDEAALAERIKQTEALETRLGAERRKLDEDLRAALELQKHLEIEAAKVDERAVAARGEREKAGALASAVEEANTQLAQREAALAQRDRDLAEREARLKASEAQAKDRERKNQEGAARAAAAAAEAAKHAAEQASDAVVATEHAEALEAELEKLRAQIAGSEREHAERARALKERLDALSARSSELETRANGASHEAAELRERLAAVSAAGEARVDPDERDALAARAGELQGQISGLGEQVAKRDKAIELLRARLAEAESVARSGDAGGNAGASTSVALRRKRLRRYRQLVQNEARKIVAAKDVLAKRQAECETVIAQRAKLVQRAQALAQREAKLGSRRSVVEATAGVCFAAGAILLVAVLSWGAVSQIFPATYIASAVVSAEGKGGGREPDLTAWQGYHEQLVTDPRLMEEAADRMGRRGIESLSKAPALAARLKQDLMVTSDKPGMLRLELRGQGAERTARELETFATALVAMANTARESRGDGAGSVQSQTAKAGEEPVKDERFMYTGAFTAGGTGLAAVIGLVAWTQLSRAKRRYEAAGIGEE
jgi:colicin import membrane protein